MVNGEQELSTISDNDGVFSVEAEDLPE